jgi:CHAT domain
MQALTRELVELADMLDVALGAHRAVSAALGDDLDVRLSFEERADAAEDRLRRLLATGDTALLVAGARADIRRHLAALLEYRGDLSGAAAEWSAAREQASDLIPGGTARVEDRFAVARAMLRRSMVLRRSGDADAVEDLDRIGDALGGSGMEYADGLVMCELGLLEICGLVPVTREASLREKLADLLQRRLPREAAHVHGTLGCLSVERADLDSACDHFASAARHFGQAQYPLGAEVERALDIAVATYRLGRCLEVDGRPSLEAFDSAVRAAQSVPAGWFESRLRGDPFHDGFDRIHLAALSSCARATEQGLPVERAAVLALSIIENSRRSGVAALLRDATARTDPTTTTRLDPMMEGTIVDFRLRVARPDSSGEDEDVEQREVRAELIQAFSTWVAEAFLPEPVDEEVLARSARGLGERHALVIETTGTEEGALSGVAIWIRPGGEARAHTFVLSTTTVDAIARLRRPAEGGFPPYSATVSAARSPMWADVGDAVFPGDLRSELISCAQARRPARLVLAPGGPLAYLPWAALRLSDQVRLIEGADLEMTPAITLLEPKMSNQEGRHSEPVVAVMHYDGQNALDTDSIRTLWRNLVARGLTSPTFVTTRAQLLAALEKIARLGVEPADDGDRLVYIAAHGDGGGAGLNQRIRFPSPQGNLDALQALAVTWPRTVVCASCHVSAIEVERGVETFGLPTSCLAGGADVFVGGVHEVDVSHASGFHAAFIEGLTATRDTVVALGDAQRLWLAEYQGNDAKLAPANWAALRAYVRS